MAGSKKLSKLSGSLGHIVSSKSRHNFSLILVFLPSVVTVLSLNGGVFFSMGQIVALVMLIGISAIVFSTLLAVYKESAFAFISLVGISGFFLFLVTDNYSPVVMGNQDPGYYTAFSRVLSQSLGSPFDSSGFELTSSSSLPSLVTENWLSEIQFYPMLPSLLASIEWVFGKYSYVVLGAASAFLVMTVIVRVFDQTPIILRVFLSGLWLFMPATMWFSRTPSSEIVSVPILALALGLGFLKIQGYRHMMLMIFMISLALMLARANPLLLALVSLAGFHHSRLLFPLQNVVRRLLIIALSILSAVVVGLGLYLRHLPSFTEVIFFDIYGPHLDFAAGVLGFGLLIGLLWLFASKLIGFGGGLVFNNSNWKYINYTLATVAVTLLFTSTGIVLFTNEWGVYDPSVFGIGESVVQRFENTPARFLLTSFGLALILIRVKPNGSHRMLLTALGVSLIFATIRNPGIPYSYFYERYWWSEIALILLFLIAGSLNIEVTKVSILRFASSILVLSSIFNVIAFDRAITELTEGVSERDFVGLVRQVNSLESKEIFYEVQDIGWLSQIIIPLRYSYGMKMSELSEEDNRVHGYLISSIGCQAGQQLFTQVWQVPRLRRFTEQGLEKWISYEYTVFVCNLNRE